MFLYTFIAFNVWKFNLEFNINENCSCKFLTLRACPNCIKNVTNECYLWLGTIFIKALLADEYKVGGYKIKRNKNVLKDNQMA